jgi:hypothetical protein
MRNEILAIAFTLMAQAQPARTLLPPTAVEKISPIAAHPRLVFRPAGNRGPGRTFDEVRTLHRTDPLFRAILDQACLSEEGTNPAALSVCWIVTGEDRWAQAAVSRLLSAPITRSGNGSYSDVWAHALAYDWLHSHPALDGGKRAVAAARIAERLATELSDLDDTVMALWHGRNQAANGAMVAALAIGDLPEQAANLQRAAAHYAEALRALQFSEGWPEGPSYWIHNRAAPYAIAADCFLTATGLDRIADIAVREVLRRTGLWTIYQLAPDGVFEPYGDSGYRNKPGQLGYWEACADYFARLSRDPAVMAGADWLRNQSASPYGPGRLQWYMALAYDPSVRPASEYDPARPELWMRAHLPQADLFGRNSLGVAFFRGAWGDPDELYATFKAGDLLAHHDHYDAGHFSIQRGGLLAPITGPYVGYESAYRLGYAIQTVSSNSLLILAPGETSLDLRSRKTPAWTSLSGGQRVIRSTGFDCLSLQHFQAQLHAGPHLERARIGAYESVEGHYDYIAADITSSYNSTRWSEPGSAAKVSLVTRQFVYVRPEQAFVIYDRIETTDVRFTPKFLLHSLSKPQTEGERLLAGSSSEDGILSTSVRRQVTSHGRGVLTHYIVLPPASRTLNIGGPHFDSYVERDGDQSNGWDGVNVDLGQGGNHVSTIPRGLWRSEVEPARPGLHHRFLNVLLPRLTGHDRALPVVESVAAGAGVDAVRVGSTILLFAQQDVRLSRTELRCREPQRFLLLDARPGASYDVAGRIVRASAEGVLAGELPAGGGRVQFIESPPVGR